MKIQDALNILGLPTSATQEQIKQAYRQACKTYHPDRNHAGLEMMKAINAAFDTLKGYSPSENINPDGEELDYGERFNEALKGVLRFDLHIEVCGAWIWVTGNTYPLKDQLKTLGFTFAKKKKAWYFRPALYKSSNRGSWTLDKIRKRHGCQEIRPDLQKELA